MDEPALALLTAREREALLLLAQGCRVAEIGPRLGVSCSTVETHLKSARRKLGHSSSLLAARAVYGSDVPPRNLGSGISGMAVERADGEEGEPVSRRRPVGERSGGEEGDGPTDHPHDILARLFGRGRSRNGLSRSERVVAWLLLTALVGIGSFASLAIPYLVQALRRH